MGRRAKPENGEHTMRDIPASSLGRCLFFSLISTKSCLLMSYVFRLKARDFKTAKQMMGFGAGIALDCRLLGKSAQCVIWWPGKMFDW
jgi:hypothetical protein